MANAWTDPCKAQANNRREGGTALRGHLVGEDPQLILGLPLLATALATGRRAAALLALANGGTSRVQTGHGPGLATQERRLCELVRKSMASMVFFVGRR